MRTAKTLIKLGGCPGSSKSSLGAQVISLVLPCCGSYVQANFMNGHIYTISRCFVTASQQLAPNWNNNSYKQFFFFFLKKHFKSCTKSWNWKCYKFQSVFIFLLNIKLCSFWKWLVCQNGERFLFQRIFYLIYVNLNVLIYFVSQSWWDNTR